VASSSAIQASTVGLTITSPLAGTQVSSGSTVPVIVEPNDGVVVDRILLVGPGVAEVDETAPFEFNLTIPSEAVGTFELSAIGSDNDNNFYSSNTVTLQVIPPAILEAITIVPQDAILFAIGENRNLAVLGSYSDGVVRDITSFSSGTEYLTSSPEIVTVSPEGVVTSTGAGIATIVARNDTIQDSINITVLLGANQAPIANAGLDQTVAVGNQVVLNGSDSLDPDSGPAPLSFEWLQIAGQEVTLSDPLIATPIFTPSIVGSYTFSLIVRDGQADSEPDSVTITTSEIPAIFTVYLPIIQKD
jgi:hypothetical protein